ARARTCRSHRNDTSRGNLIASASISDIVAEATVEPARFAPKETPMASTHVHAPVRNVPDAGSYTLDPTHSYVAFTARHLMVTQVRGRFPVVDGALVIGEDANLSSVEAKIDVSAVESGDP